MNGARIILAAAAMLLLSACGLTIPNPVPYVAGCATRDFVAAPEGVAQFFFLSSALPDCRARADFADILRVDPPPPFRRDIGDGDLAGYEIAPDGPDPDGLCLEGAEPLG